MTHTSKPQNQVTLQLNDRLYDFVKESAERQGISASKYLSALVSKTLLTDEVVYRG